MKTGASDVSARSAARSGPAGARPRGAVPCTSRPGRLEDQLAQRAPTAAGRRAPQDPRGPVGLGGAIGDDVVVAEGAERQIGRPAGERARDEALVRVAQAGSRLGTADVEPTQLRLGVRDAELVLEALPRRDRISPDDESSRPGGGGDLQAERLGDGDRRQEVLGRVMTAALVRGVTISTSSGARTTRARRLTFSGMAMLHRGEPRERRRTERRADLRLMTQRSARNSSRTASRSVRLHCRQGRFVTPRRSR